MKNWWFNSLLFKKELERKCGLNKSMDSLGPIENTGEIEYSNRIDRIRSGEDLDDSSYRNPCSLHDVKKKKIRVWSILPNIPLLIKLKNRTGDKYFIGWDFFDNIIQIVKIPNQFLFLGEIDSWNKFIIYCINNYLQSEICIATSIVSDSDNYSDGYIYRYICGESRNNGEGEGSAGIRTPAQDSDLILEESSNDIDGQDEDSSNDSDQTDKYSKYRHLWVLCDNCYGLNYKRFLKEKMNICEHCEWHLKMNSSDRIDLLIDPDTWNPMDEDMVSLDPIEWDSSLFDEEDEKDRLDSSSFDSGDKPFDFESSSFDEEDEKDCLHSSSFEEDKFEEDKIEEDKFEEEDEPYKDRLNSYQANTGLPEAVQTGIGEINGIPVAVGVMDFEFIGGSMGSVVGEKITRLIEYATNQFLPLIIVCASGGARMQEGSVSLMQMAKISSALYDYQSNKKLFYVSILASPTTGGVTASFGMLGDIIIAEPNAYIAFAGKRVIEELLKITVPEGLQETENLFDKGAFDLIVPRNLLKSVLTELFKLHGFFPLTKNENQNQIEC
uniref:Acetyl-coenzyme A carboxylase carboxyl transferase subunit beta, chloroplastic n=1 Tax=Dischidia nummularia TaxID=1381998 RepID=A0A8F5VDN0_9GENT|nr:acetyl-CoA carboxylase carboxyltransferase beta subunit [Dischidia nummularia]